MLHHSIVCPIGLIAAQVHGPGVFSLCDIESYFAQATAYSIMWQELTGTPINQIVILVSASDGTTQEFVAKPVQYVPALKRMIDLYWKDCNPFDKN